MDLCNAMEGWRSLWGSDYFARHNFGVAAKLSTAMGTCSFLYARSKDSMSLGQG